ncbi:conserved hypothetical protein [Talaromyces marneffei ATCC 18224]|uniref:Uncharacterized protein n=1 Tax=Talaromyces marneffei (strain ATCC 18224 / CBS 334.59 / QM 7333) TaxID=441960 RepID=B6QU06_TALMQ|nr:conserved hypothetical protein [Talaromyces marneffei ATCC 18224]
MTSNGPIDKISKKVASGIAFATEVHYYNKAKKAPRKQQELEGGVAQRGQSEDEARLIHPPTSRNEQKKGEGEDDYQEWELDEAQDELVEGSEPQHKFKGGATNPDKLIAAFLAWHPFSIVLTQGTSSPSYNGVTSASQGSGVYKVEFPVVIPQRRPQSKKRGFIRSYAPDLANMGIDQATWLDFIETFNEASLANPWINALNLASIATCALPSAIGFAVSLAIMVATNIAMETQARYRTRQTQQRILPPSGLYCLVMRWDSSATNRRTTNVDLNAVIQKAENTQGKMSHKFKSSSGTTSEFEFMQTAELVFPGLDYLAAVPKEESRGLKYKIKRGKLFVNDYMDRKAQAKFAGENLDNFLSKGINPTFASKYSDPNHPIHSGSIYSLASLGRYNPPNFREPRVRRDFGRPATDLLRSSRSPLGGLFGLGSMATQAVSERGQESSGLPSPEYGYQQQHSSDHNIGYDGGRQRPISRARSNDGPLGIGRLLQRKVLYLMVVNMPTEEEFAQARELSREWDIQV